MANDINQLLSRIPDENEVRQRLAENLREAAVLRALLRVAHKNSEWKTGNSELKPASSEPEIHPDEG